MTEEDKALLRQYEGAGGLGMEDASVHGTLYEYYTPRSVTKKVWQLVDKYTGGGKCNVLEPSAGTGRFAEDRPIDNFTLNEYDKTSARIAGILNPNAQVTQGAFQEMFKPGKKYTGKKYDVVIGNPPYGSYEGLWKGKGEGADHQRYEEYFIDRGLDTLREGGIMAFVVPSSFLRGSNDRIKEKIAAKGKLLEAWRLPNGTFSTTGVGTDIIVIRKEKGDAAVFSDNAYFKENPAMVAGEETTRTGRFGKEESYVALSGDDTFDSAIDRIKADAVEAVPLGDKTALEQEKESVTVSEAEEHRNRSDAMKGNQNAKKNELLEIARKMGEAAYLAKKPIIPARDSAFMDFYGGEEVKRVFGRTGAGFTKEGKKIMQEWQIGWNRASDREYIRGNDNAVGPHDVDTAAEFNARYNKHIPPEALPVWKAVQWDGSIDINQLDEKSRDYIENSGNYVKNAEGQWFDIVNFASGDIYGKLDRLEQDKGVLSKEEYERQKALLEAAIPLPKTVLEFEVSPLSAFAENFVTGEIGRLSPPKRIKGESRNEHFQKVVDNNEERPLPLIEAFKNWLGRTSPEELALTEGATRNDIYEYVNREPVRAAHGYTEEQKEANRAEAQRKITARREAGDRLFNQYIRERLSIDDQKRLAEAYNRQYNGRVPADYSKIPVFLDGISKTFKGQEFKANESQMKTVSWLANQGNGIVALDVGVGKTVAAIMSAMNDVQMGRCKKPVVAVPKSVYKNWVSEIKQLFPGIKLNELGNFSDIAKFKNADENLNIDEGSISLCTYEALNKIGFKDETLQGELRESFMEALDATTDEDREAAGNGSKSAQRKGAKQEESIMTKVGQASRTGDNWVNWEDTGFDHITVDEAHNFRNSFSKPRNKNAGDADEFRHIPGGSTSLRGLKLFAVTQMIQKHNNGRNVHLLTATPFQNSPVEIYNMLSLVAREQLKQAGIYNFHEFLTQFAELKPELVVDSKNNMVQKNVMKGFKNLSALQNLLNQYIMKIDGEDAGIVRPDKTDHRVELTQTAEQRDITEKIRAYMEAGPDPKKDPGGTLRCINALRQAALSPALVDGFAFLDSTAASMAGIQEPSISLKKKDFVKDSPKMTFVCDTTTELYRQHPDKGQIIHLPQGVKHYGKVKEYLVSKGIPADAIAFLAPEYLKSGDAGNDQKEEITQAFNDPGNKLKIIIGSDTIKEGVNLNGNTMQTYECMLAWNPTDTQQLKGRSWRQNNRQGMVHITFPLMTDSVDSFMYQKHDEKGSRLNTLWNAKQDKIDLGGIDPEELKFSLIKDPKKRADLIIREKTAALEQKRKIAEATSDKIFTMAGDRKNLVSEIENYQKEIVSMKQAIDDFNAKNDDAIIKEHELDFSASYGNSIYDDFVSGVKGKNMKEIRANYGKEIKEQIATSQKNIQRNKGKSATIDNTLNRYGIIDAGNMVAVERIQKRYSEEALGYKSQIEAIEKDRDRFIQEATAQIKNEARPGITVGEAVEQNTRQVSGNLYSMDE